MQTPLQIATGVALRLHSNLLDGAGNPARHHQTQQRHQQQNDYAATDNALPHGGNTLLHPIHGYGGSHHPNNGPRFAGYRARQIEHILAQGTAVALADPFSATQRCGHFGAQGVIFHARRNFVAVTHHRSGRGYDGNPGVSPLAGKNTQTCYGLVIAAFQLCFCLQNQQLRARAQRIKMVGILIVLQHTYEIPAGQNHYQQGNGKKCWIYLPQQGAWPSACLHVRVFLFAYLYTCGNMLLFASAFIPETIANSAHGLYIFAVFSQLPPKPDNLHINSPVRNKIVVPAHRINNLIPGKNPPRA